MGLRDEQREARRRAIQAAAVELFEVNGWAGTTTERVAAAAGVSLPTLFRYYPTKADLLCAEDDAFLDAWVARVATPRPNESLHAAIIAATIDGPPQAVNPAIARLRTRWMDEVPELRQRQLDLDQRGQTRAAAAIAAHLGRAEDDPTAAAIAAAAMASVRATQRRWRAAPEGDLRDAIRASLDALPQVFQLLTGPPAGAP